MIVRRPLSVRARIVLLAVATALAAGGIAGYAGLHVVGNTIEDRQVHGAVREAALLVEQLSLQLSDRLLGQMSTLAGGQLIALLPNGDVLASSLPPARTAQLLAAHPDLPQNRRVAIGEDRFLVGRHRLAPAAADSATLILLVPRAAVREAKYTLARTVALGTAVAIAVALAIGFALSRTITVPIRALADRMSLIAAAGLDAATPAPEDAEMGRTMQDEVPPAKARDAAEIAALRNRFDTLIRTLRQAQESLRKQARLAALGKVAVSVAHELRNPLSAIRMHARLMAEDCRERGLGEDSPEVLEREIDRMDLYLEELMSLRPDADDGAAPKKESQPLEPVDVPAVARSVLDLVAARCRHAGIATACESEPPPPPVRVDARRFRQVLMNLVLNAMEAMPQGGELTVQCLRSEDSKGAVCRVRDTGGGLPHDTPERCFEAFFTTKEHGAGLGLYICRRIVEQLGGRITAGNTEDGAEFTLELPR